MKRKNKLEAKKYQLILEQVSRFATLHNFLLGNDGKWTAGDGESYNPYTSAKEEKDTLAKAIDANTLTEYEDLARRLGAKEMVKAILAIRRARKKA